jgi:tetratricopeptide (TPR) repeat protein
MKRKTANILVPVLALFLSLPAHGQKGVEDNSKYGHNEDSIRCIKNLSLYREYVKSRAYDYALGSWQIVFDECPLATKNIYIDGARMYNDFINKASDPARKAELMDSLRLIYDRRIKYYKQEGSVLGRKAYDILRHQEYRQDPDIVEEAYEYLKKSVTILKNKSSAPVIGMFMTSSVTLFQAGRINEFQVIEDYAIANDILDFQLKQKPDNEDLLKVKNGNDVSFISSGAPTCESLISYFEPKFEDNKNDLAYLKRVVGFMTTLECETEPFYAKAAENLYKIEPSATAAFGLAKLFLAKEDYEKAITYYEEAINSEEDDLKKADYYYQLAFIINAKRNQPQTARNYALEAIKLKPDWGEPYILIGDAYAAAKECFEDEFEKATIYWAAVDKFAKAKAVDPETAEKANDRISTYSRYFPDVETIFFYSLKEGDSYNVGCWINETTTVRPR